MRDFDCGDEPFAVEINEYLKADLSGKGALYDIQKERATVFLYGNGAGDFVGFSSYGTTTWPIRGTSKVHHIVALGINRQFRRMPEGPRDERYANQILDDVIRHAMTQNTGVLPVLTLFVHPENHGARRLYTGFGFQDFAQTYRDKATGVIYQGMALSLSQDVPLLTP